MTKRPVETADISVALKTLKGELNEQRARIFIFHTDAHRKLGLRHTLFENAMAQAERLFSGDNLSGTPFIGQKELLDGLASLMKDSPKKVAILSGPTKDARDLAIKMERNHPGFAGLVAIDLPPNYDQDETITGHLIEAINRANVDVVLISSLLKNQEIWLANYRHRFNCSIIIGLH
jgi:UDP-N-acetyl-D-mannosaminuronic acid transferase (WecB/TagA/CpsF family)